MNMAGYEIEHRILRGERACYDAHPIILGLFIMEVFPDIEAAADITPEGSPEVLRCGSIPGGANDIYAALSLLQEISQGQKTPEEAVEDAETHWAASGDDDKRIFAQQQADRFSQDYLDRAKLWLGLTSVPTP